MTQPGESNSQGFASFTLAELTLIQEGLWMLGRADAVNPALVPDWRGLVARLRPAIQAKVAESLLDRSDADA